MILIICPDKLFHLNDLQIKICLYVVDDLVAISEYLLSQEKFN